MAKMTEGTRSSLSNRLWRRVCDHVTATPARVGRERALCADVETGARGGLNHVDQRCDVLEAEVEALPRQRVDDVCGVASKRDTRTFEAFGDVETDGEADTLSGQLGARDEIAGAPGQFQFEAPRVEFDERRRDSRLFGPDKIGAIALQWQHRHRSVGQEDLSRDAIVRLCQLHRG